MNYRYDWLFNDDFFSDEFIMKKRIMTKDIGTILVFLDDLSKLDYIDENINKFLNNLNDFLVSNLKAIYETVSISQLYEINWQPAYISEKLRSYLVSGFYQNYKPIIEPDVYNLNSKASELNRLINEKDFSLTNYDSFDNFKRYFRLYLSTKRNFDDTLENERKKCLDIYNKEISSIEESTRKLNSYIRFKNDFDKIVEEIKSAVFNYICSNDFIHSTTDENCNILNIKIVRLCKDLNIKNGEVNKIINYMTGRMNRLKNITPKDMDFEEGKLFYRLHTITDKVGFDSIYSIVYTKFMNHKYDDEKIMSNFRTKKKLNIIKRKVDNKYYLRTKTHINMFNDIRDSVKDYIYSAVQKVMDYNTISLEPKNLSDLTFYDFIKDLRLINESLNGNCKVSENCVYIPKLDGKDFNRGYAYPLLELSFEHENIGINELTKNVMQDGELDMNYNTFLYQYMSINTYIKKSEYIGKRFIVNDLHNKDFQDFSNSELLLSYNGILLIETNGEYEVVSYEAVTMAGYDIPESDKLKQNTIDNYKKELLTNIINVAESFRDECSPLNYEKTLR